MFVLRDLRCSPPRSSACLVENPRRHKAAGPTVTVWFCPVAGDCRARADGFAAILGREIRDQMKRSKAGPGVTSFPFAFRRAIGEAVRACPSHDKLLRSLNKIIFGCSFYKHGAPNGASASGATEHSIPPNRAFHRKQRRTKIAPSGVSGEAGCRLRQSCYSFRLGCGWYQAGSLLLQPLVVSIVKSASVAVFRSRTPSRSADTAQMFQSAA